MFAEHGLHGVLAEQGLHGLLLAEQGVLAEQGLHGLHGLHAAI